MSSNLGFDSDQIVIVDGHKAPGRDRDFTLRNAFLGIDGVSAVGSAYETIGSMGQSSLTTMKLAGSNLEREVLWTNVDYGYLPAVGVALTRGRFFAPQFEDANRRGSTILNESAVRALAIPEPVIGEIVIDEHGDKRTIVGVVDDFHAASLHDEIKPLAFHFSPYSAHFAIRLDKSRIHESIAQLETVWTTFSPDRPIDLHFLDTEIDNQYRRDRQFLMFVSLLTAMALMIACVGMLALSSFAVARRTKELGVRKVLGATSRQIGVLLVGAVLKLVLVANIVAWPVAYIVCKRWLESFAYHTPLGIRSFVVAALVATTLACLSVAWTTVRAARTNPIVSLRYE